jgi:GntR family transcriptional regulator
MPRASRYPAIVDDIRAKIRTGELRPGDPLPSIERLKAEYGVSYGPVRTAMLELKATGWVRGEPGRGVFVTERPTDRPE